MQTECTHPHDKRAKRCRSCAAVARTIVGHCAVAGCGQPIFAKGFCRLHYHRQWATGTSGAVTKRQAIVGCAVEGCHRPHLARGFCKIHYDRLRLTGRVQADKAVRQRQAAVCSVPSCRKRSKSHSLCEMHNWRRRVYGDATYDPHKTPEERFWRLVEKNGPVPTLNPSLGPCWLWQGNKGKGGYGRFFVGPDVKDRAAYRYAYRLLVGPIAEGLEIDHLCCVPSCVNPDHLEPVTKSVNVQRVWQRGRAAKSRIIKAPA